MQCSASTTTRRAKWGVDQEDTCNTESHKTAHDDASHPTTRHNQKIRQDDMPHAEHRHDEQHYKRNSEQCRPSATVSTHGHSVDPRPQRQPTAAATRLLLLLRSGSSPTFPLVHPRAITYKLPVAISLHHHPRLPSSISLCHHPRLPASISLPPPPMSVCFAPHPPSLGGNRHTRCARR